MQRQNIYLRFCFITSLPLMWRSVSGFSSYVTLNQIEEVFWWSLRSIQSKIWKYYHKCVHCRNMLNFTGCNKKREVTFKHCIFGRALHANARCKHKCIAFSPFINNTIYNLKEMCKFWFQLLFSCYFLTLNLQAIDF